MPGDARRDRDRRLRAASGYLEIEMAEHALRELKGIASAERTCVEFHRLHGEALRMAGRFEAALDDFSQALACDEEDVGVLMGLAWCYKRTGQLPRAIAAAEQAYRVQPTQPILLYNLACYHALAQDKTQALSWLGRALRMKPALRELISLESDFDSLRNDRDFRHMTD